MRFPAARFRRDRPHHLEGRGIDLETVASRPFATQMNPSPDVIPDGPCPTRMVCESVFVAGSIREMVSASSFATQIPPSPATTAPGPLPTAGAAPIAPLRGSTTATAFGPARPIDFAADRESEPARAIRPTINASAASAQAPASQGRTRRGRRLRAAAGDRTPYTRSGWSMPLTRMVPRSSHAASSTRPASATTVSVARVSPGLARAQRRAARLSAPPRQPSPTGTASPASSPMPMPRARSAPAAASCRARAPRIAARADSNETSASSPRNSTRCPSPAWAMASTRAAKRSASPAAAVSPRACVYAV